MLIITSWKHCDLNPVVQTQKSYIDCVTGGNMESIRLSNSLFSSAKK